MGGLICLLDFRRHLLFGVILSVGAAMTLVCVIKGHHFAMPGTTSGPPAHFFADQRSWPFCSLCPEVALAPEVIYPWIFEAGFGSFQRGSAVHFPTRAGWMHLVIAFYAGRCFFSYWGKSLKVGVEGNFFKFIWGVMICDLPPTARGRLKA